MRPSARARTADRGPLGSYVAALARFLRSLWSSLGVLFPRKYRGIGVILSLLAPKLLDQTVGIPALNRYDPRR